MPPKTKTPAKPAKAQKSKINRNLDELHAALVTKGAETHVAVLIRDVYGVDEPAADRVLAAVEMMALDERFAVAQDGIKSLARIAGPEEVRLPDDGATTAASVATAAKTIGELAEDAKLEEAERKAAPAHVAAEHSRSDDRLEEIEAASEQYEKALQFETLKKADAKRATTGRKASHEHLLEVLGGQGTILKKSGEVAKVEPAQKQTGRQPQDAKAPAAERGNGTDALPDPRAQGAKAAISGKTESDCPLLDADLWLDGWREQMRADNSQRKAIVQGMTPKKLGDAMVGLLEPAKAAPKVASVMIDARPHMVVGCLGSTAGPIEGVTRWHLQPCFEPADWTALHRETYGPAIEGVDASDEAKANRIRGGIDCGRIVKIGKAKFVVGPRQLLTVLTTGEPSVAAAT